VSGHDSPAGTRAVRRPTPSPARGGATLAAPRPAMPRRVVRQLLHRLLRCRIPAARQRSRRTDEGRPPMSPAVASPERESRRRPVAREIRSRGGRQHQLHQSRRLRPTRGRAGAGHVSVCVDIVVGRAGLALPARSWKRCKQNKRARGTDRKGPHCAGGGAPTASLDSTNCHRWVAAVEGI